MSASKPTSEQPVSSGSRCDHPGCLSRATSPYLVGLGGMTAFYCVDHAPREDPKPQSVLSFTHVRTMHPYGYRSGRWAELLTIAPDPEGRDCLVVRFPDQATDFWVLDDPDGRYEFEVRR